MKFLSFLTLGVLALVSAVQAEVKLGNEVLAAQHYKPLYGKRVGLITNPSGVNRRLEATIDVLRHAPGVKLVALYGPEHGIYGDIVAGDKIPSKIDERTGLPVHSLYGKTRKATPDMLKDIDVLVYDLQDNGCRSYTFVSSMGLAMEACAENNVEFMVLDRPNPLGGERVEGRIVQDKFRSFVSQWNVPYVYGMTPGELAQMINGEKWISKPCKLTVIPLKGWKRSMSWADTGLPWVPTSPHIPHADSAMFYVATGILGELAAANIGVGYTQPFECFGLTNLDKHQFAAAMNKLNLPGLEFRPITYKPFYSTLEKQVVSGVQVYITNPRVAPLTSLNFYLLDTLKKETGRDLLAEAAALKPKAPFDMFDKVNGTDEIRKDFQSGKSAQEIVKSWEKEEDQFRVKRHKYLLYK